MQSYQPQPGFKLSPPPLESSDQSTTQHGQNEIIVKHSCVFDAVPFMGDSFLFFQLNAFARAKLYTLYLLGMTLDHYRYYV